VLTSKKDQSDKIYSRNENECHRCDESFYSKNELKKHMNEKHKSLKCRKCETPAGSEKELKKHIKEKHPVESKCKVCEKAFKRIVTWRYIFKTFTEKKKIMNVINVAKLLS
jgi:hypothetical protein